MDAAFIQRVRHVREGYRVEDGGGGLCHLVTEWLQTVVASDRLAVSYLSRGGDVICAGHYVCILSDGTMVDPTADQFGEGHDVRVLPLSDPEYGRYRPEFDDDWNPATEAGRDALRHWGALWGGEEDYDQDNRLAMERGEGWRLADKTAYRAYWEYQMKISDDHYLPHCQARLAGL